MHHPPSWWYWAALANVLEWMYKVSEFRRLCHGLRRVVSAFAALELIYLGDNVLGKARLKWS